MNYSKSHQYFNHYFGDECPVLAKPENFLGPNYKAVLNFWSWIDTFTDEQIHKLGSCYHSTDDFDRRRAWDISRDYAETVVGHNNRVATFVSTQIAPTKSYAYRVGRNGYTVRDNNEGAIRCAKLAAYELISMHILLEHGHKLFFVPMFEQLAS